MNDESAGKPVTDSYSTPLIDRLTRPLAPLDPDTTLTLAILKDTFTSLGGPGEAVPEPSTWAMMVLGGAGLIVVGRFRLSAAASAT